MSKTALKLLILACGLVAVMHMTSGCSRQSGHNEVNDESKTDHTSKKIKEILDRLNSWDKLEIDAVENPDDHPYYEPNGESVRFVEYWKTELRKLGCTAKWDREEEQYIVCSE